jgi:LysW-gamma-L-lysine/LysW-L-ornithine aminotransferase
MWNCHLLILTEEKTLEELFALENAHTSGLYNKHPVAILKGRGALVWDAAGREFIDCVTGHGVAALGHAHPEVTQAIAEQAALLVTCPESYYTPKRAELAEQLAALVPGMSRVFFCNSGAEAVEAALKFARYSTGRTQIVAAMRGFHGRTFGALSATWKKSYRQPFEPLVPGFSHVPFNQVEPLEKAVTEETAALLLEPVQGEGGVYPVQPEFLEAAQALCRERGALLIADEVQTGMGRTGKMFAFEHFGVQPDLLCLAKSIAGGVPMGAVLIGPRVNELKPGLHYTTFGGNPLACAAALAVLRVMQRDGLPQQAAEKGRYFMDCLRQIDSPSVREVRGLGLMTGIELKRKAAPVLEALMQRGVLALSGGLSVVRFLPPLIIDYPQLDRVVSAVRASLAAVEAD